MSTSVWDIPVERLEAEHKSESSHASLAMHLTMGMDAVIDIMRERAKAHETLGEAEAARGLLKAIDAAAEKKGGLDAEYIQHSTRADLIERRIAETSRVSTKEGAS